MARQDNDKGPAGTGRRKMHAMRLLRIVAALVLVVVAVHSALLVLAPYLISTGTVRSAMERSLSAWTGEQVTIGGDPEISFWPEPRIALPDIKIVRTSSDGDNTVGRIDRLSASFGIIAALSGNPAFSDFQFTRPVISVSRLQNGHLVWTGGGLLGEAIAKARDGDETAPSVDAEIGTATITDGTLDFADEATGRHVEVSQIEGEITWPRLSSSFSLNARATIEKHGFGIELSTAKPLQLFAGKDTDASVALRAPGFGGYFDGRTNLFGGYFLAGPMRLDFPDMQAFLAWTGWPGAKNIDIKTATIRTTVQTIDNNMRLDAFTATLDDNNATGVVDVMAPMGKRPKIGGTLAFDTVSLGDLIDMFSDLPEGHDRLQSVLPGWLDFDVTLSATTAEIAPFRIDEMAASILTAGKRHQIDVVDGQVEGGDLSAHILDTGTDKGNRLQLSLKNVDFASLGQRLALQGPLPTGRVSLDLDLKVENAFAKATLDDLDGTLRVTSRAGTLTPFNLSGIRNLADTSKFFQMSDAGAGSLSYDRLTVAAHIADGTADIETGTVVNTDGTLNISGLVPFVDNSLALFAEWVPTATTMPDLSVFVGGSWPDPVISPMKR